MSPVNEHRIVCKAVTEENVAPLLARGVTGSWFFTDEHRRAIDFVLRHHAKYARTPTLTTFEKQVGNQYELFEVGEDFEYLIDVQVTALQKRTLRNMQPDLEDLLDAGDIDAALKLAMERISIAQSFQPMATKLVDTMDDREVDQRWTEYEARETVGTIIGFTTGFPTIDKATLGLQPGHLVTVVSQPKVGKTTLCLAMANHVYTEYEQPVLFVTYEMSTSEIAMRQDSLMAGINFTGLQSGKLVKSEKKQYGAHLDTVQDEYLWSFNLMDASVGVTVSVIKAQIERLQPGVVFVDGVYMMRDEATGETNTPQALTGITRGLKRVASQMKVPIVVNTQALAWKSKGQRITADSIGYSSSFLQDSDVVLGMERIQHGKGETAETYATQRNLKVLASRNSGLASVTLFFDYDHGQIKES